MMRTTLQRLAGPALVLTVCSAATAAPMPREGNFDFNYCLAGKTSPLAGVGDAVAGPQAARDERLFALLKRDVDGARRELPRRGLDIDLRGIVLQH